LEWLDPQDINQRRWAIGFLLAKGYQELFQYQQKIRPDELPSHEQMLHAGIEIERNAGARELLKDMKDAWRQQKNRNKKKQEGHLACTFTLNSKTKGNLKKMASELNISATTLVENLIARAYQSHIRKQAKHPHARLTKTPQSNRIDTLRDYKENYKKELPQESFSSELLEDKSSSTNNKKATDALSISNDALVRSQENSYKPIKSPSENIDIIKRKRKPYLVPVEMQEKITAVDNMEAFGLLEISPNIDE